MLLQNTLDLSTFEIVRFRIWNQTSNPDDYGVGTKYFNTNSGHEGYNRENIYTATGWRKTAYLDDIEALTNGEGSLGTRVKALEDMLKVDSAETVVSTWAEIQAFLDNVKEGTDLMDLLNSKLNTTGGTINGTLTVTSHFSVGENASIGGRLTMKGLIAFDQYNETGKTYLLGMTEAGGPLRWYNDSTWKTIAFTDSTVEAANKLADDTAYTVWGRTFFENGKPKNVSSSPIFNNNGGLYFKNAAGDANKLLFYFDTAEQLHIGRDSATDKKSTHIYGNPTYFKSSNTGQPLVTITEEGRVAVGSDYSIDGDKLYSRGRVNILSISDNPTLGNAPIRGLILTDSASKFGMSQWISETTGHGNIQGSRFDGTATAIPLNLNPLGGAVNVGGNLAPNANNSLSLGTSSYRWSNVYSVGGDFSGRVFIGNADDDTHSALLVKGGLGVTGNMFVYSNDKSSRIITTIANNIARIYSLSQDGSVIRDMYIGDYSGRGLNVIGGARVLIGGAGDDGETALQVNNTMSIGASKTNFGLRFNCNTIYAWIPENHAYGHNANFGLKVGDTLLGVFGHHREANGDYFSFIGTSNGSSWFSINSEKSNFNVLTTFNGGALIPTGQTLTIGSVTIKEVATGEIEVNGNLHTTGTLASGGKGEVGENTTGNAMVYQYDLASGESVYTVDNVKGSTNVIVQIFEWNGNTSSWDMILTDVSVKADAITVTFGRTTTVNHMVTVC